MQLINYALEYLVTKDIAILDKELFEHALQDAELSIASSSSSSSVSYRRAISLSHLSQPASSTMSDAGHDSKKNRDTRHADALSSSRLTEAAQPRVFLTSNASSITEIVNAYVDLLQELMKESPNLARFDDSVKKGLIRYWDAYESRSVEEPSDTVLSDSLNSDASCSTAKTFTGDLSLPSKEVAQQLLPLLQSKQLGLVLATPPKEEAPEPPKTQPTTDTVSQDDKDWSRSTDTDSQDDDAWSSSDEAPHDNSKKPAAPVLGPRPDLIPSADPVPQHDDTAPPVPPSKPADLLSGIRSFSLANLKKTPKIDISKQTVPPSTDPLMSTLYNAICGRGKAMGGRGSVAARTSSRSTSTLTIPSATPTDETTSGSVTPTPPVRTTSAPTVDRGMGPGMFTTQSTSSPSPSLPSKPSRPAPTAPGGSKT